MFACFGGVKIPTFSGDFQELSASSCSLHQRLELGKLHQNMKATRCDESSAKFFFYVYFFSILSFFKSALSLKTLLSCIQLYVSF